MGPSCAPKGKLVHLDEETLPMAMDGKLEAEMVWVGDAMVPLPPRTCDPEQTSAL